MNSSLQHGLADYKLAAWSFISPSRAPPLPPRLQSGDVGFNSKTIQRKGPDSKQASPFQLRFIFTKCWADLCRDLSASCKSERPLSVLEMLRVLSFHTIHSTLLGGGGLSLGKTALMLLQALLTTKRERLLQEGDQ